MQGAAAIADETRSKASEPSEPSEKEVVARAQEGDHEAFQVLVERYQGRAYALALRILRNEDMARDAVQDSFIKVYGSIRRFEGRSSFYTWLYRLVFNQCLDIKRKDKSNRHVEWEEERLGESSVVESAGAGAIGAGGLRGPGAEYDRTELRKMMAEAIAQLPDEARETIILREVEGLSYQEIADQLGIPKGTVMSRLHYARKRVQTLLIEAGLTPPGGRAGDAKATGEAS